MASAIGAIDIKDTRVPIVIPLAITSVFAIAQLFLGADPFLVLLSMAGILVTCLPLHFNGRDLYSICALWFSTRWIGAPLVIKTLYGQPLQSHLFEPFASYAWGLVLMIVYTSVFMLTRRFDRGIELFQFPKDPRNLRRLAVISFGFGLVAMVLTSSGGPDAGGGAGALGFFLYTLKNFLFLGVIAEAVRNLTLTGGRNMFGPMLAAMLIVIFFLVSALNARGFFVACIVAIFIVAFIYRAIKIRYIVAGLIFGAIFMNYISPVILYLRSERGLPTMQFIELSAATAWRAASDPDFRRTVKVAAESGKVTVVEEQVYDYYGDRSNVANRLSFIGLFDRVYMANRNLDPLGMDAVLQSVERSMPRSFGLYKAPESTGDWLAWNTGLVDYGGQPFLNFGLPMEGYTSWGWIGAVTYPFVFVFPWLFLFTKIASFRTAAPVSIMVYCLISNDLIEGTSDSFVGPLIRTIPMLFLLLFALHFVFFRSRAKADANMAPVEA